MGEKRNRNDFRDKFVLEEQKWLHKKEALLIISRLLVSCALLASGFGLLMLRLEGWSLIFGLPMVIFGSIFMIYTYDELLSTQVHRHSDYIKQGIDQEDPE